MTPLDLDRFQAKPAGKLRPVNHRRPPRHKAGEWFLKGPIPGEWLALASGVSFRALRAGLALWYLAGLKRSRSVKPTRDAWRRFGLSPDAGRRGVAALEQAGLVVVDRRPGCCPVVTLLCVSKGFQAVKVCGG